MKKILLISALVSSLAIMSFTPAPQQETVTVRVKTVNGYIDFKIKNDTGTDHSIISSSGGSKSLDASSSAHSISMKDGDDVYMYDGGRKGDKILHVDSSIDGKTFMLSDLIK